MKVTIGADTVESSEIVLVGECITAPALEQDESFLVVITADGQEHSIPMSGGGFQDALVQLEKALGIRLAPSLLCGDDFVSRAMFPPELEGKPFYMCLGDVNAHLRRGWFSRWWHNPLVIWEIDEEVVRSAINLKKGRASAAANP